MKRRSHSSLLRAAVLSLTLLLSALTTVALRREHLIDTWRPEHYDVAITLDDKLREITSAQADIELIAVKPLSLIDLDFEDLNADSVSLNGNPIAFIQRDVKLNIFLPKPIAEGTKLRITIRYHGIPREGLILTTDKDGKRTAVGDNWPNRLHHWIPCLDHPSAKASVTFKITAASNEVVIANGRLNDVQTNDGGTKTWSYSEGVPIPPYCMIIVVGDFVRLEPQHSLLAYYVPQSDSAFAMKGFASAGLALEMFGKTVAPYPYEKLALIIGATRFGGMENSSAIVFRSTLFDPKPDALLSKAFGIPGSIENVVSHEIAHQWFGDSVTQSTWSDLWLSEGFATYFAGLFIQKYEGDEAFLRYMNAAAETALEYEKKTRTAIHDRDTEDLSKLLNGNNYQKGAWVLHMLRSRLGDDHFFRGIRTYYQEHKNATASSEDLRTAFEKASGQELRRFFDRWVYESGHPLYKVSWKWLPQQQAIRISLQQIQEGNAFLDPVPLLVTTPSGTISALLKPAGKSYSQTLRSNERPTRVDVDPQNTLLKEIIN